MPVSSRASGGPVRLNAPLLALVLLGPLACGSSPPNRPASGGSGSGGGGIGQTAGSGGSASGGSGGQGESAGGNGGAGGGSPAAGATGADGGVEAGGDGGGSGGGGAGGAAPTGHLFGSHSGKYPDGAIQPAGGQPALDAAVKSAYDRWKTAYVTRGCGGYYVKTMDKEPMSISSSPAIGAGMILAAIMAGHDPEARTIFDGLFTVARKYPSYLAGHQDLVTYVLIDGCTRVKEGDSTVDGDLDFAFALLLADRQWGSGGAVKYLDEAKKTIAAIKKYDMNPTLKVPLIGDWASLPGEGMWFTVTKPPHFMLGHFRAFATAAADPFWMETVEKLETLTAETQARHSPASGLLPAYLVGSTTPPAGTFLGDPNAGNYYGDSSLIPLRLASDYIASGDGRSKAALAKMTAFIRSKTGGDPAKIVDGYKLDGTPIGTAGTMSYVAPFAAAAIFDAGNQDWLDATWKLMTAAPPGVEEAERTNILGMLVVSRNWWSP